jgi:hypothetical protein
VTNRILSLVEVSSMIYCASGGIGVTMTREVFAELFRLSPAEAFQTPME